MAFLAPCGGLLCDEAQFASEGGVLKALGGGGSSETLIVPITNDSEGTVTYSTPQRI